MAMVWVGTLFFHMDCGVCSPCGYLPRPLNDPLSIKPASRWAKGFWGSARASHLSLTLNMLYEVDDTCLAWGHGDNSSGWIHAEHI